MSAAFGQAIKRPTDLESQSQKVVYYQFLAEVLESNKPELLRILSQIGSISGAEYEVDQAIKTLRGVEQFEIKNLENSNKLRKLVVFGSSNIPLYSLVLHGLIPSTKAQKIIYKASSSTNKIYNELWELILRNTQNQYDLTNINVLTSAKASRSRNRIMKEILGETDKVPADLVVYTGNPERGQIILILWLRI